MAHPNCASTAMKWPGFVDGGQPWMKILLPSRKDFGRKIDFSGLQVDAQTLRGNRLSSGRKIPSYVMVKRCLYQATSILTIHTQVDLPCTQMEIKTEDYLLRLDFGDL